MKIAYMFKFGCRLLRVTLCGITLLGGTSFLYAAPNLGKRFGKLSVYSQRDSEAAAAANALELQLKKEFSEKFTPFDHNIKVKDWQPILERAFRSLKSHYSLIEDAKYDDAIRHIIKDLEIIESGFHAISKLQRAEYVEGLAKLASAYHLNKDDSRASQWISRALVIDPKLSYIPGKYPKGMKDVFDSIAFLAEEMGVGVLRVETVPAHAFVYINGREYGRAPLRIPRIKVGRNLISVKARGYESETVTVNIVESGVLKKVELKEVAPMSLMQRALKEVETQKIKTASKLTSKLGVNTFVFAKFLGGGQSANVVLYAYSAEERQVIGVVKGTISFVSIQADTKRIVDTLIVAMKTGQLAAEKAREDAAPSIFTKMVKSKYFIPVVVGVLVVGGVTAGIVAGTQSRSGRDYFGIAF